MQTIQLTIANFGGIKGSGYVNLQRGGQTIEMLNGHGKTTIVNAYVWALCGRTLQGFEARHINVPEGESTYVEVVGLLPKPFNRLLKPEGGTLVFYGGIPVNQKAFEAIVTEHLAPMDFVLACADLNALTDPALTPAQLRSLLYVCGALNESEGPTLRAERTELAKRVKEFEKYALANVAVPIRTKEPLTRVEEDLLYNAANNERKAEKQVKEACEVCGALLDPLVVLQQQTEKAQAQAWLDDYAEEIERVRLKKILWSEEDKEIQHLTWLSENAKSARKSVIELQAKIEELDEKIREADAKDVAESLPEGVSIITEKTTKKAGSTLSTCSLTINGVPLKSVNRSARINLLVQLLFEARAKRGVEHVPILVDNAESIDTLPKLKNVVWFTVKH